MEIELASESDNIGFGQMVKMLDDECIHRVHRINKGRTKWCPDWKHGRFFSDTRGFCMLYTKKDVYQCTHV